jgi:hypothetical protein
MTENNKIVFVRRPKWKGRDKVDIDISVPRDYIQAFGISDEYYYQVTLERLYKIPKSTRKD